MPPKKKGSGVEFVEVSASFDASEGSQSVGATDGVYAHVQAVAPSGHKVVAGDARIDRVADTDTFPDLSPYSDRQYIAGGYADDVEAFEVWYILPEGVPRRNGVPLFITTVTVRAVCVKDVSA